MYVSHEKLRVQEEFEPFCVMYVLNEKLGIQEESESSNANSGNHGEWLTKEEEE